MPDGIASGVQLDSALRQAYMAAGALPGDTVKQRVVGRSVRVTGRWASSKGDAVVGAWQ